MCVCVGTHAYVGVCMHMSVYSVYLFHQSLGLRIAIPIIVQDSRYKHGLLYLLIA